MPNKTSLKGKAFIDEEEEAEGDDSEEGGKVDSNKDTDGESSVGDYVSESSGGETDPEAEDESDEEEGPLEILQMLTGLGEQIALECS